MISFFLRVLSSVENEVIGGAEFSSIASRSTKQVQNEAFLASRRTSPTIKARENALQDLDLAYHRYREVLQNLTEGVKVRLGFSAAQFDASRIHNSLISCCVSSISFTTISSLS